MGWGEGVGDISSNIHGGEKAGGDFCLPTRALSAYACCNKFEEYL
jgi:hypothetical protein